MWKQEAECNCQSCVLSFPDTYVKLTLISPSGKEVAHSKTSVRRGQPNPLFKESFMFQVALFQLADVTLMVSVYNKKSMKKKEMIGWFALGKSIFLVYCPLSLSFSPWCPFGRSIQHNIFFINNNIVSRHLVYIVWYTDLP